MDTSLLNGDTQTPTSATKRAALVTEQPDSCPTQIDKSSFGNESSAPIRVIGYPLRFPQEATSSEAFWRMLEEGRSARTDIPSDRFNVEAFYHPDSTRHDSVCDMLLPRSCTSQAWRKNETNSAADER